MTDTPENPSRNSNTPENEEEDFATLFENYMSEVKDDLKVGEEVNGEIISIEDENIFINTGTKIDGVVNRSELCDQEGQIEYRIGDMIKLYVVSVADGEIRLSRAISGPGEEQRLYDAHRNAIPVEGKVTETCKGGFRVNIMGKSAFCPVSQIDSAYVENPEEYVGNTCEFLISRIESRGKNIVVSRRELLNRYIAQEREKFINTVKPGDILKARITKVMPYGAFAEVAPGVEGMIHISELSWKRVDNPEEAVSVNDTVNVAVLDIEEAKDTSRPLKISLSIKAALTDPWTNIFDRYQEGDKIRGTVTRCADFGAFVEIEAGIEGLVHISELSYRRVVKTQDVVQPGDVVAVMIKGIDPAARRISLSMKDAKGDPWIHVEDNYTAGQPVTGRIEKKEKFGYFIELEPGITGLLPTSKIKESPSGSDVEKRKVDENISVVIEAIDIKNRKISLGLGDAPDTESWKDYKKEQNQTQQQGDTGMGGLGEKLREAMSKTGKK